MHNNFHRYLNLPFQISKPEIFLESDVYQHFEMQSYYNKELVDWLSLFDLEISAIEAFHTPPNFKIDIHCDSSNLDDHVKINVTWGPEEGVTRWWQCKKIQPIFRQHDVTDYKGNIEKKLPEGLMAFEEDCIMLYEKNTNIPSLVNVGKMHSTYNPSDNESRWTLCFVLKHKNSNSPYVVWNDALDIFEDYILK